MWYPDLPNTHPPYAYLEVELNFGKTIDSGTLKKTWWTDDPEKDMDETHAKMDEVVGYEKEMKGTKTKWKSWKNAAGPGKFKKFQQPTAGYTEPILLPGRGYHGGLDIIENADLGVSYTRENWFKYQSYNKIVVPVGAGRVSTMHYGNGYPGGNEVSIWHNSDYTEWSLYCHFSAFSKELKEGKFVNAQTVIGHTGYSGPISGKGAIGGPHLHLSYSIGGTMINPNIILINEYS